VALARGSGPHQTGEVQALLGKRLRFIGLGITALYALETLIGLQFLFFLPEMFAEYWWRLGRSWFVSLAVAVLTGVLWTKRPFSLRQLRVIEILLFGLVLVGLLWDLCDELFVEHRLRPFLEDVAAVASSDNAWNYVSSWLLGFCILIVGYGVLVPSTWRRCTVVVGSMSVPFVLLFIISGLREGGTLVGPLGAIVVMMVLWLAIASGIAIFGAHRIEVLRQEVFKARKLGQYQLKRLLGTGGMGEVYLAEHVLLKRPCALKLIRPERAGDPSALPRFEREVQATATLTHPNVVEIYDYGHADDNTFYYVMEYLSGLSLDQLVKCHGPVPPARAVHLLRQVCGALRAAHGRGLIHRDLKPGNVIVGEGDWLHDTAKLLDFGLVQSHSLESNGHKLTQEGALAGTPAYMSPEQAAGQAQLDARSDIYSLGCIAYFLLTGRPPFVRDTAVQTLAARLTDPPEPLTSYRPDVPADLQAVVLRCLEKDPARRFQSADELEQALASCGCADEWRREHAAPWWRQYAALEQQEVSEPVGCSL
jgi:serine/threonine-protein kinase